MELPVFRETWPAAAELGSIHRHMASLGLPDLFHLPPSFILILSDRVCHSFTSLTLLAIVIFFQHH
jgi:hypothetical protein